MPFQHIDLLKMLIGISKKLGQNELPLNIVKSEVKNLKNFDELLNSLDAQGLINLDNNRVIITECGWDVYLRKEMRKKLWIIAIQSRKTKRTTLTLKKLKFQRVTDTVYIAPFSHSIYNTLKQQNLPHLIIAYGYSSQFSAIHKLKEKVSVGTYIAKAEKNLENARKIIKNSSELDKYSAFRIIQYVSDSIRNIAKSLVIYNAQEQFINETEKLQFSVEYISFFFPDLSEQLTQILSLIKEDPSPLNSFRALTLAEILFDSIKSAIVGEKNASSAKGSE